MRPPGDPSSPPQPPPLQPPGVLLNPAEATTFAGSSPLPPLRTSAAKCRAANGASGPAAPLRSLEHPAAPAPDLSFIDNRLPRRRPRAPSSSSSSSSWTGARCCGGSSQARPLPRRVGVARACCMGTFYYMNQKHVVPEMCAVVLLLGIASDTPSPASTRALCVAPNGYFEIVLRNFAFRLFVPGVGACVGVSG